MIGTLVQLAGPYLTKVAIDTYIAQGDRHGLLRVALLYLLILALGFLFQFCRVFFLQWTGQKVMLDIRGQIFRHLLRMSTSFFDRRPTGQMVSRLIHDVEVINDLFTQGVIVIFGDLFTLIGIAAVLFWMDWRLAATVLSLAPLVALETLLYRKKAREAYRKLRVAMARLNTFLVENLSGMTTVQVFGRDEENFRRFIELNRRTRDQHLRSIHYSALFFPCVEVLAAGAMGIIIWYGGGRVIQEALLPGVLVAFLQYLRRFFQPVRDLAEKYNILQAAMAAGERIFQFLDTPPEIADPVVPRTPSLRRGSIRFEDVWFSYDGDQWVLPAAWTWRSRRERSWPLWA
jgi:ATP-binding cassette subfamily B protein